MAEVLAIDFGTSRTKVAYYDTRSGQPVLMHHNGLPFVPSLFYLPRGSEQVFWGQDAEDSLEDDPAGVVDVLKRRLKEPLVRANGRRLKPGELLTQLLLGLRQRAGKEVAAFAGRLPDKVVLTHPVLFGPVEDDLLRDAARTAGFQEVELIPEPVAAARAWLLETGEASAEDYADGTQCVPYFKSCSCRVRIAYLTTQMVRNAYPTSKVPDYADGTQCVPYFKSTLLQKL